MDKPIDLEHERKLRNNDARDWTPAEALRELLGRIESGEVKVEWLTIHYTYDDGAVAGYNAAGLTRAEHVMLLEMVKQKLINEWQGIE